MGIFWESVPPANKWLAIEAYCDPHLSVIKWMWRQRIRQIGRLNICRISGFKKGGRKGDYGSGLEFGAISLFMFSIGILNLCQ